MTEVTAAGEAGASTPLSAAWVAYDDAVLDMGIAAVRGTATAPTFSVMLERRREVERAIRVEYTDLLEASREALDVVEEFVGSSLDHPTYGPAVTARRLRAALAEDGAPGRAEAHG